MDELHKLRIKEEFSKFLSFNKLVLFPFSLSLMFIFIVFLLLLRLDVEPWSFEQKIGEAVIIPAGCPYQMTKIKVIYHPIIFSFC